MRSGRPSPKERCLREDNERPREISSRKVFPPTATAAAARSWDSRSVETTQKNRHGLAACGRKLALASGVHTPTAHARSALLPPPAMLHNTTTGIPTKYSSHLSHVHSAAHACTHLKRPRNYIKHGFGGSNRQDHVTLWYVPISRDPADHIHRLGFQRPRGGPTRSGSSGGIIRLVSSRRFREGCEVFGVYSQRSLPKNEPCVVCVDLSARVPQQPVRKARQQTARSRPLSKGQACTTVLLDP